MSGTRNHTSPSPSIPRETTANVQVAAKIPPAAATARASAAISPEVALAAASRKAARIAPTRLSANGIRWACASIHAAQTARADTASQAMTAGRSPAFAIAAHHSAAFAAIGRMCRVSTAMPTVAHQRSTTGRASRAASAPAMPANATATASSASSPAPVAAALAATIRPIRIGPSSRSAAGAATGSPDRAVVDGIGPHLPITINVHR